MDPNAGDANSASKFTYSAPAASDGTKEATGSTQNAGIEAIARARETAADFKASFIFIVSVFLWLKVEWFKWNRHGKPHRGAAKTRVSLLLLYCKNRKKASPNAEKNAFSPKKTRDASRNMEIRNRPAGGRRSFERLKNDSASFPRFPVLSI